MSASLSVPRIDNLDAMLWNDELFILWRSQFRKALQYLPQGLIANIAPELETFYKYCFWALPLRTCLSSSFGQRLFGIEYRNCSNNLPPSKSKFHLLTFLLVGLPWFWERVVQGILRTYIRHETIEILENWEHRIHTLHKFSTLLNFCIFLQKGTYPTVYERLLGIKPYYTSQKEIKELQFESINRELLWHGFAEFLTFVLPLINIYRIKGTIKRLCKPIYKKQAILWEKQNCAICGELPTFPHKIGCRHIYCYYCISSNIIADQHYFCSSCKHEANGIACVQPLSLNSLPGAMG